MPWHQLKSKSNPPLFLLFKEGNFSADFQDVEKFVTSRPPRESGDSGAITRKQIYSQGANEFSANQLHPEQAAGIKTAVTASVLESKFATKRHRHSGQAGDSWRDPESRSFTDFGCRPWIGSETSFYRDEVR